MATRTARDHDTTGTNRLIGWGLAVLVLLGFIAAVVAYDPADDTPDAIDQANALVASMEEAGMDAPDPDVIARVYGADGGAVCRMSGAELSEFTGALNVNRAGGEVNVRPGFVDPRVVRYGGLVVDTYCPDKAGEYDDFVRELRVRRTREALAD